MKKQVSEEKPKTPEEFRDIIINVSNDFDINLNQQTINNLVQYAQNFDKLGIDWDQLSQQFESLRGDIKDILNSETTQGIIDTIFEWLGNLFKAIGEFFTSASSRQ